MSRMSSGVDRENSEAGVGRERDGNIPGLEMKCWVFLFEDAGVDEEEEDRRSSRREFDDDWRNVPQGRKTEEGINPCRHASILGTHTLSLRSPVKGS